MQPDCWDELHWMIWAWHVDNFLLHRDQNIILDCTYFCIGNSLDLFFFSECGWYKGNCLLILIILFDSPCMKCKICEKCKQLLRNSSWCHISVIFCLDFSLRFLFCLLKLYNSAYLVHLRLKCVLVQRYFTFRYTVAVICPPFFSVFICIFYQQILKNSVHNTVKVKISYIGLTVIFLNKYIPRNTICTTMNRYSRKPRLTAVGIRCADHVTPSIR
jgi:hypothetical protein